MDLAFSEGFNEGLSEKAFAGSCQVADPQVPENTLSHYYCFPFATAFATAFLGSRGGPMGKLRQGPVRRSVQMFGYPKIR